jgi:hypothetical protein
VEKPSDIDGPVYIALNPTEAWKGSIAKERRAADLDFDANGLRRPVHGSRGLAGKENELQSPMRSRPPGVCGRMHPACTVRVRSDPTRALPEIASRVAQPTENQVPGPDLDSLGGSQQPPASNNNPIGANGSEWLG